MGLFWQLYGTCSICLLSLIMGLMFAWPSSTIKLFESHTETPLAREMTTTEISLYSSLSSVGALLGTPLFGYALDKIGRKYSAIASGISYAVAWTMISAFKQVEIILTAVFISGLGGSCALIAPLYVGEICQSSIRGALTSGSVIFYGIGVLLSYVLGGYMSYYGNIYTQLTLSVVYVLLVSLLKESPMYLMQKSREEEAAKAIAFYRSKDPGSKEVLEEIYTIKRILNPVDFTSEEEMNLNNNEKSQMKQIKMTPWRFIAQSPSTKSALFVTLVLVTCSVCMGLVVIQVFAEPLFLRLAPSMSANLCSILLAVVSVVAGVVAAYFTDKAGRRALMIYSAMASGVCMLVLGTQLQWSWGPQAVTAAMVYLFCVAFSFGSGTIPYVLVAEVFLPEIKSFCSIVVLEWAWLVNFLLLFVFNPLDEAIGLAAVFFIFSAICFATMVFAIIYQPETKGLPVDEIQILFTKRRRSGRV